MLCETDLVLPDPFLGLVMAQIIYPTPCLAPQFHSRLWTYQLWKWKSVVEGALHWALRHLCSLPVLPFRLCSQPV